MEALSVWFDITITAENVLIQEKAKFLSVTETEKYWSVSKGLTIT